MSRQFLDRHRAVFHRVERLVGGIDDPDRRGRFVQRLLGRLVFVSFLRQKGWLRLDGSTDYLPALWREYAARAGPDSNFYRDRLLPLLEALFVAPDGTGNLGRIPHLGGGLLWGDPDDGNLAVVVPDEAAGAIVGELLSGFDFCFTEGAASEGDRSVDPEMLGGMLEALATDRRERGCFYTPKPVVSFICREALKGYLESAVPAESLEAVARLIEQHDGRSIRNRESVAPALRQVRVCDPACGSGAFLLGMLQELMELRRCVSPREESGALSAYRRKLEVIQDSLRGIDVEPMAVETARLRLWLSLAAEWEGDGPPPPVDLRAVVEVGDTLTASRIPDGFDVVVMNPPYLAANRLPGERRGAFSEYARRLRATHGFVDDLYVHFFHRALRLLREGGVLAALTSGTFLVNCRKESLRRELLRHRIRLLMPMGVGAFAATVYPAITVLRKGGGDATDGEVLFLNLRASGPHEIPKADELRRRALRIPADEYRRSHAAIFFEPTPEHRRLFGTLLTASEIVEVDGQPFAPLGLVAPVLDTGIDSGNVRHRLFYRDAAPGRPLHRLLQGCQVVRYAVWWENPRARYRFIDVEYEPDLARRGVGRGGRPSARPEYWGFRGPRENHHVPERLLMRQTADEPFVGYLHQGLERIYTDNTLHTLLLTERGRRLGVTYRYLLALLNSAPLRRIYRAIAQEEGRILPQVKISIANRLPIPIPTRQDVERLESLVTQIQGVQQQSGFPLADAALLRTATLQTEIDRLVTELYQSPHIIRQNRYNME